MQEIEVRELMRIMDAIKQFEEKLDKEGLTREEESEYYYMLRITIKLATHED